MQEPKCAAFWVQLSTERMTRSPLLLKRQSATSDRYWRSERRRAQQRHDAKSRQRLQPG